MRSSRFPLSLLLAAAMAAVTALPARAHFVWVFAEPESSTVQVSFAEGPEPGAAGLVDRLKPAKAWLRVAGKDARPLELSEVVAMDADTGTLDAAVTTDGAYAVEVVCPYGVFERGGKSLLLEYYAKHLGPGWETTDDLAQPSEHLALDVVPRLSDSGIELEVTWHGAPAAEIELVAFHPSGDEQKLVTDPKGRARIQRAAPGEYWVRAQRIDPARQGEIDGRAYTEGRSFATLTFAVAGAESNTAATTAATAKDASASELLRQARDGRALWEEFPGFAADVTVHIDSKTEPGQLKIDADGKAAFTGIEATDTPFLRQQLGSLIAHRLPDASLGEEAAFEPEEGLHVLGPRVRLAEEAMGSVYRIHDNVITEVNREMGGQRFTISVLDVERNAEGKYLPAVFTVSFWDAKTGKLNSSLTYDHRWRRVGKFDLPERLIVVSASDDERTILRIDFSKHRLLDEARAARAAR